MNAAQGVILIMGSALVLWLMWSAQSPFSSPSSSAPRGSAANPGTTANPLPGAAPGWGGNLGAPGWTPKGMVSGWGPTPGSAGLPDLGQRPAGVPSDWILGPSGNWISPSSGGGSW